MTKDKLKAIGINLFIIVCISFLFWILARKIDHIQDKIEIFGLKVMPEESIANIIETKTFRDKKPQNIFTIDRKAIKEDILDNPLVKDVKIKTQALPSFKIKILIDEYIIWGILNIKSQNKKSIITSNLEILEINNSLKKKQLINYIKELYKELNLIDIYVNKITDNLNKNSLNTTFRIIQHLSELASASGLNSNISKVYISEHLELMLHSKTTKYIWGKINETNIEDKFQKFQIALPSIKKKVQEKSKQPSYIDLSLDGKDVIIKI